MKSTGFKNYVGLSDTNETIPELAEASGSHLFDENGRRYVDLCSAGGSLALGHGNELSQNMALQQMKKPPRLKSYGEGDKSVVTQYAKFLSLHLDKLPQGNTLVGDENSHSQTYFTDSGLSPADFALKALRDYTACGGLILLENSDHAGGHGSLQPTWSSDSRKSVMTARMEIEWIDPFASDIEGELNSVEWRDKAAVLVELVQTKNGVQSLPEDFIKALRDKCKKEEVPFVVDESFTGFGRTGRMFAQETFGVTADMTILGGAGGGGFPFGAVVAPKEIMDSVSLEGLPASIFAGNPMACSAGLSIITQLTEMTLQDSRRVSKLIFEGLQELSEEFPEFLRGVNGVGMAIGLELSPEVNVVDFRDSVFHSGVLLNLKKESEGDFNLSLIPAINLPKEEVDVILDAVYESLSGLAESI